MDDIEEGGHLLDLVDHHPVDGRCGIDLLAQLPRPEAVTVLELRVEEIDPERGTGPEMLPEKGRFPRATRPEEQQTARFTDRKRSREHTPNLYAELGGRSNCQFFPAFPCTIPPWANVDFPRQSAKASCCHKNRDAMMP